MITVTQWQENRLDGTIYCVGIKHNESRQIKVFDGATQEQAQVLAQDYVVNLTKGEAQ